MNKHWKIIGLMSGTSLDGLDVACCNFWKENRKWNFEIEKAETIPYSESWKNLLSKAKELSGFELAIADVDFGKWMGQQVSAFSQSIARQADFVASHGHTVFHQPNRGLTLQIGSASHLSVESGLPVISDFRSMDVAKGGQGAPLVPIGDQLLFGEYDFCLNLGGIANVSTEVNERRIAYDLTPCNMGLNYVSSWAKKTYDENGKIAKSGKLIESLFEQLNNLPFYSQDYPKSLGSEWFEQQILPLIESYPTNPSDTLHTLVHHSAYQIAQGLLNLKAAGGKILSTGGGTHNAFFITTLQGYLGENFTLEIPSAEIVDFKEALIFAFLGLLRAENQINTLASVTGAKNDSSSGQICGNLLF
ncbi:anhydro-N-acetylmuramic acid kinase [Peijinzhouia sedimentorum]